VRRALRAELHHRVQSYTDALGTLAERAAAAGEAGEDTQLARWRSWTVQLATVFDVADRTWLTLRTAVDSLTRTRP
jgi:hypothetical protein